MESNILRGALAALAILSISLSTPAIEAGQDSEVSELDQIVSPSEKAFLLAELARVQPPDRIRDLAGYGQRQSELGGGFYGMMPDQLADPDSIPLPGDDAGRLAAAVCLARQRQTNREALAQVNAEYAVTFRNAPLADFLAELRGAETTEYDPQTGLILKLDVTALDGFFAALADGEVSSEEAAALAALPSNQAMLRHRRDLGYVPEPLPDTESLATMIAMAGSTDPLDRLWCWVHSQNAFDYADLAQNVDGYARLLSDLEDHGDDLVDATLTRIARYTPAATRLETTFAFTVGWAIRGWATPEMAGLNVEQVKDDWHFLYGTLVEETYHRLQLELFPSTTGGTTGGPAREFSDLVAIDTGDARYDRLFEIVTYTVAEGAANLVRGPFTTSDLEEKVPAGAELMARFVHQIVREGDLESADALINEGLKGNGPLYGLGWKLAGLIAEHEGTQAVGEYQQKGPVSFFLRGAVLSAAAGEPLLAPEVTAAVDSLENRLVNLKR
jgi:hypothetical protein